MEQEQVLEPLGEERVAHIPSPRGEIQLDNRRNVGRPNIGMENSISGMEIAMAIHRRFSGEHFCVPHFLLFRFVLNDRETRLLDRLLNLSNEILWIILHMGFLRGEIDRHVSACRPASSAPVQTTRCRLAHSMSPTQMSFFSMIRPPRNRCLRCLFCFFSASRSHTSG
jgi:hypothetical protein